METTDLRTEFTKETKTRFNTEWLAYNDYVDWLEQRLVKLCTIPHVSNCCDCFIGFLSGEEIRKSELKRMVDDIVKLQPRLKKYGLLNGEINTAKQIVDGRKGYLSRFSYCPYCGNKIDWKTVLSSCC